MDPIALEVHPAIDVSIGAAGLSKLPTYLPRDHDRALASIVAEAQAGASRIVVLVGGSSTGKTRALWEAVQGLGEPWRLQHPITPGRPEAVLAGLYWIGPCTVVWLNETQHYLDTSGGSGRFDRSAGQERNRAVPAVELAYSTACRDALPRPCRLTRSPTDPRFLAGFRAATTTPGQSAADLFWRGP
ncbi:hypothetical protein [Sphaerisporangium sp. TRM90804]|uniref:hypothetical protein n=1 Tax=Sphaerisporangium sp. TRM90804 TaxID=3031113 RepID=UPI0024485F67|nr:hypothetical protein [Sphaerisporangium sp. TRM90804]MDH2426451.1 hypothetical protein [Sphaerisporangium sp. TRM90804]